MKSSYCPCRNWRLSMGTMDLKVSLLKEENTTVRGRCGETHPRLGARTLSWLLDEQIPWRHQPEEECVCTLAPEKQSSGDELRVVNLDHVQKKSRSPQKSKSCHPCHAGIAKIPDEWSDNEIIVAAKTKFKQKFLIPGNEKGVSWWGGVCLSHISVSVKLLLRLILSLEF